MGSYVVGRDERGVTAREREVLGGLAVGLTPAEIARSMGVTKQRVYQLVGSLVKKEVIGKDADGLVIRNP